MQIASRLAQPADQATIWQLYQQAMRSHIDAIWGWDDRWQEDDFAKAIASCWTYVVEVDGACCGYLQLEVGKDAGTIHVRMLVLAAPARSRGIGARLLAAITALGRQAGYTLQLRVFRINGAARRFYERAGWQVIEEEPAFYLMRYRPAEEGGNTQHDRQVGAGDFELLLEL